MRRWLALILLGAVSVSFISAQTAESTLSRSTPRGQVAESSRAVLEAQKTKDPGAIKHLLADDFTLVGSDGRTYDREELMDATHEGRLQSYQMYNEKVISVSDEAILVTYDAIITASEGDNGYAPRYQRVSDLWTTQGDQWRLKFEQATPLRHID